MKNIKILIWILIAIGFVLTACSSPANVENTSPPPMDTPSPTETPDQSTVPAESRLNIKCVETNDAPIGTLPLNGRLFIVAIDEGNKTYLWDTHRDHRYEADAGSTHVIISPDRTRLVAIDRKSESLIVLDSSGTRVLELPDWGDEYDIIQWLIGNQLAIKLPYGEAADALDAILVFDIATKDRQEIIPDLPLITDLFQDLAWGGYTLSPLVSNPQLSHLIYPAKEGTDNALILWDRQTALEVGRIHQHAYPSAGIYASIPAWSQDGSSFVTSAMLRYSFDPKNDSEPVHPLQSAAEAAQNAFINVNDAAAYVAGFELIRVNQNGEAQRLSYLTTTFNASQEDWIWSPDETRIAFWLTIDDDQFPVDNALAVLDVTSGEVTNYCISGYRSPIWSPDGRHIAINQNTEGLDTFKIVDLEAGIAYAVTGDEAIKIEGWMISPP